MGALRQRHASARRVPRGEGAYSECPGESDEGFYPRCRGKHEKVELRREGDKKNIVWVWKAAVPD